VQREQEELVEEAAAEAVAFVEEPELYERPEQEF
jgi:hypothetical protein